MGKVLLELSNGKSAAESNRFETDHYRTVGALILGRPRADLGIGPWGEDHGRASH
jgi:hypothetical protein